MCSTYAVEAKKHDAYTTSLRVNRAGHAEPCDLAGDAHERSRPSVAIFRIAKVKCPIKGLTGQEEGRRKPARGAAEELF